MQAWPLGLSASEWASVCPACCCSVIPGLHRVAARDIELGGYAVPAGTMLYSPLHLLNKADPRWTDDDIEAFRWGCRCGEISSGVLCCSVQQCAAVACMPAQS